MRNWRRPIPAALRGSCCAQRISVAQSRLRMAPAVLALLAGLCSPSIAGEKQAISQYLESVSPLLTEFCYDCHGNGSSSGRVSFEDFDSDKAMLEDRALWWKALKQLRQGTMPPADHQQPSAEQKQRIDRWIREQVFAIDPRNP